LTVLAWAIFALCLVIISPGVAITIWVVYREQVRRLSSDALRLPTRPHGRAAAWWGIVILTAAGSLYFFISGPLEAGAVLLTLVGTALLSRLG
jgi:hypothetical protein